MKLSVLTAEDFERKYSKSERQVYNTAAFAALNAAKVDEVLYFDIKGSECSLGIIFGKKDGRISSPFSAPFGGFVANGVAGLTNVTEALGLIREYASENALDVEIMLPPEFYAQSLTALTAFAAPLAGFRLGRDEVNYHIPTAPDCYADTLTRTGRKNLNNALIQGFTIDSSATCKDALANAYSIIAENRREHGYALRMSLDDLRHMGELVDIDVFIVKKVTTEIASAIVYRHSPKIAQVIYWGDLKEYRHLRPMNFLAYMLHKHYHDIGLKVLDIGPASTDGVPNEGLCSFKESIGCVATLKHSILYTHTDDDK